MNRDSQLLLYLFTAFCSSVFYSCKEEPVPGYVYIPSIQLTTTSAQGSASVNVTDAWVYENANLQGVYEMPVQFPIIAEGTIRLVIFAGIKLNGIAATRAPYPFYLPDTIEINVTAAGADTLNPKVRYSGGALFDMIEDFETGSEFSNIVSSSEDVFEGASSGKLMVADSGELIAMTTNSFVIPFNTPAAFLEMDYKNNQAFEVGIRAEIDADYYNFFKLTVAPRNEWNKLYVNFTPEVSQIQGDAYQVYFRILTVEPDSVKIFFDNLKLVHGKIQ